MFAVARVLSFSENSYELVRRLKLVFCVLLWLLTVSVIGLAGFLFLSGLYGYWVYDQGQYLPSDLLKSVGLMSMGFILALPGAILSYCAIGLTERLHLGPPDRQAA